jgi:hypothetical protein
MLTLGGALLLASLPCHAEDEVTFSGFLGDYSQLQAAGKDVDFLYGYSKRLGILREYDSAIVDPILVYFHENSRGVGLDPEKLNELTAFFKERVVQELSAERAIELADAPGPGVMRLRIAITDIEVVKKSANIGAKVAGAAAGIGLLVPAMDVGGATMECEVLDSVTGERLVAVVDRETGRRMMNFSSMKSMGDAKAALREWAKDFRKNLQRIHDGKLPRGVAEPE